MTVKEDDSAVEIKTEVTTAVTLVKTEEDDVKVKIDDSESLPATKGSRGKKRKVTSDGIMHASQTTATRRMSKRIRR